MKKVLPYLFLFTYSTFMLKPVMPYIADFMAHILNFQGHMATIHAHHGKYHVHYEIAEAAKNDNTEKSATILKNDTSGNEHIIIAKWRLSPLQQKAFKYFTPLLINIADICLANDFPPPRV